MLNLIDLNFFLLIDLILGDACVHKKLGSDSSIYFLMEKKIKRETMIDGSQLNKTLYLLSIKYNRMNNLVSRKNADSSP